MRGITILDGGMGKELRRIGAPFRQPEWSSLALIEAPEKVEEAHRNFIEAGAEVIITNNYAVVPFHHPPGFFEERGTELTRVAGAVARRAADTSDSEVLVAGSLPPLFGSYEPDRFDPDRAAPIYREIVAALDPFVDLWIAETLSTTAEVHSIAEAVGRVGSGKPIWIAFTFPDEWVEGVGVAIRSGEGPARIASAIAAHADDVEALLVNCSIPEQTGPALSELATELDAIGLGGRIALGAYANAFPTEKEHGYAANEVVLERREDLTPERYADFVASWVEGGATIVGGCCDMYPPHIAALAARFGGRASDGPGGS